MTTNSVACGTSALFGLSRISVIWSCLVAGTIVPAAACLAGDAAEHQDILASPESLSAWERPFSQEESHFLDLIQLGCFNYLWHEVGSPGELVLDKSTDDVTSIAAIGFQLSALPIGVERGWVDREAATLRAEKVLETLINREDNKKFGIYFHFLDADTGGLLDPAIAGARYEYMASTIDHALLQAGAMTAGQYFGGVVAKLADEIGNNANWSEFRRANDQYLAMGWHAESPDGPQGPGRITPWFWNRASDEERLIYFLAAGSPLSTHAVPPADYFRLERNVQQHEDLPPYVVSWNGALFTYFFSHCWINYRDMAADDPRAHGVDAVRVDWFENSRRAVLTHRQRCIEQSTRFPTLGVNRWGLTPCLFDGKYPVHNVRPNVSGMDRWFDGVLAPYGAASCIMFAPEEVMAALTEYRRLRADDGSPLIWRDPADGGYGFVDAFKLDPPQVAEHYLGIDQGPMLLAIENARTGLVWDLFMDHPVSKVAFDRLKFKARDVSETSAVVIESNLTQSR